MVSQRQFLAYGGRYFFSRFVVGTEAAGADGHPLWFSVYGKGNRVDIGHPAALGMTLGMAHIITEHRRFAADITLQFLPLDHQIKFR